MVPEQFYLKPDTRFPVITIKDGVRKHVGVATMARGAISVQKGPAFDELVGDIYPAKIEIIVYDEDAYVDLMDWVQKGKV